MIDYLKNNWKTVLVGGITFIVILLLCCCESKPAEVAPVIEETPVEVAPMTDEEIEKIF